MRLGGLELVKPSTPMKGFVKWLEGWWWWWWCGGPWSWPNHQHHEGVCYMVGGVVVVVVVVLGVEMTSAVGGPGAGQAFNSD